MIKYDNIPVALTTVSPQKAYFGEENMSASDLHQAMRVNNELPSQRPGFVALLDMPEGPAKDARRKELESRLY
jgi:hypothetical protein